MNKISKNQKGFSAVEAVLIVVIVVLVGVVGWQVYKDHHKTTTLDASTSSSKTSTKSTSTSTKTVATTNPYAGWLSYTNKTAGYTIKYPSDWTIYGSTNNGDKLTGNESVVTLYYPNSKDNSLGITIYNDTQYETTGDTEDGNYISGDPTYSDGSIIKTLSNGMGIWSESESALNTNAGTYANLAVVNNNSQFGYKLDSGSYLQIQMNFNFGYGQSTTYTFSQQVNSPLVTQAESILSSITQD